MVKERRGTGEGWEGAGDVATGEGSVGRTGEGWEAAEALHVTTVEVGEGVVYVMRVVVVVVVLVVAMTDD